MRRGLNRLALAYILAPLALAFILAPLALCTRAEAQTIDYGALERLFGDAVTTSATGSPQTAYDAPVTMEIITAEDIRRSGARDIPGVLQHVAGIDVERWTRNQADVSLRGYNTSYSPRLLVLLDGRQVYADFYGWTPWSTIPVELSEIRQIEVVKGPNSALFGFNAGGGVINIVTYNPLYDAVNTVSIAGGTGGEARGSAVVTTKLGDIGALRLVAGGYAGNDFQGQGTAGSRRGDNRGDIDVTGVFRMGRIGQITLDASHSEADQSEFFTALSDQYTKYGTDSVKGQFDADTQYGSIEAAIYSNWLRYSAPDAPVGAPGLISSQLTDVQIQDRFKPGAHHTLRFSIEYRHTGLGTSPSGGGNIYDDVYAASAMWEWKLTPRLSLTNALRVDDLQLGRSGVFAFGGTSANALFNRNLAEPSFNSGLVWHRDDLNSFRVTAARGVQLPNLLSLGGYQYYNQATSTEYGGNPNLAPTIITNYEIGWDRDLPDLGGQFRADMYYQMNDNFTGLAAGTPTLVNGVTIIPSVNLGNSNAAGLELSLKGVFAENWRWGVNYTPEIITDHNPAGLTIAQTGVSYQNTSPNHIVNANLGWGRGRWDVDLFAQYKSQFEGVTGNLQNYTLEPVADYLAFDARIGYRVNDRTEISLSGQNITQAAQHQTVNGTVQREILGMVTVKF